VVKLLKALTRAHVDTRTLTCLKTHARAAHIKLYSILVKYKIHRPSVIWRMMLTGHANASNGIETDTQWCHRATTITTRGTSDERLVNEIKLEAFR